MGRGLHNTGHVAVNMRDVRDLCVFFFTLPEVKLEKLLGPQEDSGAALEFTDCVFTKAKRARFHHDPVPSVSEGNWVFWLFTVGCVANIKNLERRRVRVSNVLLLNVCLF